LFFSLGDANNLSVFRPTTFLPEKGKPTENISPRSG
jgi:hypothetical protein